MIWNFVNINPVALDLWGLKVHWYGIAYVVGLMGVFKLTPYLAKKYNNIVSPKILDDFFTWAVLGIILGGRLGYVLFYQPSYYLLNPIEVLYIMNGGMSFHGGILGVAIAMYVYAKRNKVDLFAFSDAFAVSVPIGLFFGRIANFVNAELWGRPTDGSWGVIFPNAGDMPRHPSQLYEAGLEGLLLLIVLLLMVIRYDGFKFKGLITGTFMMLYGISRIIVEGFREPDAFIGYLAHGTTWGQWLSVPMVILGANMLRLSIRSVR
ncbi:MAG: prolipoprotein diacylglyceryl transferase [Alphaproteobacteria bacterium]